MTKVSRALVTGASAGIGLSFARQLAAQGTALVLVARRADRLETLAAELRAAHDVEVEVLAADLGAAEGVAAVEARLGADPAMDMLINNAGFGARGMVAALDADALEAMLRVNVIAMSRLSTAAMRTMRAAGRGAIVNVSSGTIFMQIPGNAGYGASKSYAAYWTRTMQAEAAGSGVQVQLLIPGVVETEFHQVAGGALAAFPPQIIMQADVLVAASLRALELGEGVCIPSLPDVRDWEALAAAERAVAANVSRDRPAARYGVGA